MRKPEYLSPTGISTYLKNREEFYIQYLADIRAPRMAQTQPMSIGSSFDAYVKSYLHEKLFGKGNDPKFGFEALFEAQVEPQNRTWAKEHGRIAFSAYQQCGALADLMLQLQRAVGTPRFELEVKGAINGHREGITKNLGDVTFLGKPDVFYVNEHGVYIILDWKVNGWCSTRKTSPMAGYLKLRQLDTKVAITHKECLPMAHKGTMINVGHNLEMLNKDWARQLSIYAWLCGLEIGDDFVAAIDQMVCEPIPGSRYPIPRVAEHRLKVTSDFQWQTYAIAEEIWHAIASGHIFQDRPREDSDDKCRYLEKAAAGLAGSGSEKDQVFADMTHDRIRRF